MGAASNRHDGTTGGTAMSASFALTWTLIAFGSMYATYRLGIREERARWVRRMDRWQRRQAIIDGREREQQEGYEMEGFE
jgi:hypothetical protein